MEEKMENSEKKGLLQRVKGAISDFVEDKSVGLITIGMVIAIIAAMYGVGSFAEEMKMTRQERSFATMCEEKGFTPEEGINYLLDGYERARNQNQKEIETGKRQTTIFTSHVQNAGTKSVEKLADRIGVEIDR